MLLRKFISIQALSALLWLISSKDAHEKKSICDDIDKTVELDSNNQYAIPKYKDFLFPNKIKILAQKPKGNL